MRKRQGGGGSMKSGKKQREDRVGIPALPGYVNDYQSLCILVT